MRRTSYFALGVHMLRLIITMTYLVLFLIVSLPIMGVLALIGLKNPSARDHAALRIVQWGFKGVIFLAGTKVTVIGRENIPEDEAVLFVGNHRSFFDVIIGYTQMKGLTGFISKKEMAKVPSMSLWMKFLHCLFLDRSDIKEGMKTILAGIELLKNGISLVVFPEGTRNTTEAPLLPFHEGSMKLATKSGVRVIPMVQCNTSAVFEDNHLLLRRRHTIIEFGEPIDLSTLSPEDKKHPGAYLQKIVEDIYLKNLELI